MVKESCKKFMKKGFYFLWPKASKDLMGLFKNFKKSSSTKHIYVKVIKFSSVIGLLLTRKLQKVFSPTTQRLYSFVVMN